MRAEITRLKAIDPDRLDALVTEALTKMDPWMRRLLSSTDPFKSRLLRIAVLRRAGEPPAPTETPQLRLVYDLPADDEPTAAFG